jgi:hypothetical protein
MLVQLSSFIFFKEFWKVSFDVGHAPSMHWSPPPQTIIQFWAFFPFVQYTLPAYGAGVGGRVGAGVGGGTRRRGEFAGELRRRRGPA